MAWTLKYDFKGPRAKAGGRVQRKPASRVDAIIDWQELFGGIQRWFNQVARQCSASGKSTEAVDLIGRTQRDRSMK